MKGDFEILKNKQGVGNIELWIVLSLKIQFNYKNKFMFWKEKLVE
jgi:hypothetical protein